MKKSDERESLIEQVSSLDISSLKSKLFTTHEISVLFEISKYTLRNYRKGFYFESDGGIKWFTDLHDRLNHIPQGQLPNSKSGGPVTYKLEWVNDFLRKIGQEKKIPPFLRHV